MQLNVTDLYTLYRPSPCELRVFLRQRDEPAEPPGPYEEVLRRLGERHERDHLRQLGSHLDLSDAAVPEAATRTREAVARGEPLIYQGALCAQATLADSPCEIVGRPDFLIRVGEDYQIRDAKMSRRITEQDHPEILLQLQVYGWLFEETFGRSPIELQVLSGSRALVPVPVQPGHAELEELARIAAVRAMSGEPRTPVGWSRCGHCGYRPRCWSRAEQARDVALIPDVDQGLAQELYGQGVETIQNLLDRFDGPALEALQRPWGAQRRRVGKLASRILRAASALASGSEIVLRRPNVPASEHYAVFDVEGLPPQLDELDRIYLWGLQVFGSTRGQYLGRFADVGPDSDRKTWESFLESAESVLSQYGEIPFVHWHHYERVKLEAYIRRYGDPTGVAARVRDRLVDLFPITKDAVVLPLPSYTLKLVEKHVGYRRTLTDVGGDWAMATYIEAIETDNCEERNRLLEEVRKYNEEDLQATWAVLVWLKSLQP